MNKMHKQLLTLLALAGISNKLMGAYEYDFRNMIGDPIVLKINQSRTDKKDYYQIVPPGKTVKQTFPMGNAYCLAPNGIQWAPYDKTNPFNGGADFIDKTNLRIPEEKQREFGDKIAPHYTFLPVEIIMLPNAVYDELSKSATQLLKGIDALACQTIESVKALKNPLSGVGGGSSGGGSSGVIVPKTNKITQVLELLDQLKTIISGVDMNDASTKANVKNTITVLLSKDNIKLLTDIAKINMVDIGKIKNSMINPASKDNALVAINTAFDTISGSTTITAPPTDTPPAPPASPARPNTPAPTTPPTDMPPTIEEYQAQTAIDTDVSINTLVDTSSSYSSDYSGYLSGYSSDSSGGKSSTPQTQNNRKCSFGLGKIGKASGKLAKTTLCTSREFTIYYKTDENDIPIIDKYGRPVLTAETVEGQ